MTERFSDALVYAVSLHRGQLRKGSGCPYISHLLAVVSLVMEAHGDEDECIAALLHDAIEDQGGSRTGEQIRHHFGNRVAGIVEACSEPKCLGMTWNARKQVIIRRVADANPSTLLVISADKLHNVRSLIRDFRARGEQLWEQFNGGRDGTLWYYRAMADAIRAAGGSPLSAELEEAVRILEAEVGPCSTSPAIGGHRSAEQTHRSRDRHDRPVVGDGDVPREMEH